MQANTPLITVPLVNHVEALVGSREFAVIDSVLAGSIKSIPGHDTVCVVENSDSTCDFTGALLKPMVNGLYRLWLRRTWDITINAAKKRSAEREAQSAYDVSLRKACAEYLHKQTPALPVEMLLPMFNNAKRNDMEQTLLTAGVSLPQKGQ